MSPRTRPSHPALRRAPALAAVVTVLVAAACTGGPRAESQLDTAVKDGVQSQLEATAPAAGVKGPTTPRPSTMDEWQALWARERAAVVEKIRRGGFGVSADGRTLVGPGDLRVDLSRCPAGWSDTEGLSASEIRLGATTPLSGPFADYGNIARGADVLLSYQNDHGGWTDSTGRTRTLSLVIKDDGYDASRTIPLVDELIDSVRVFAVWTLGSPNTLKTYDKLNGRCIPQPFVMTGHPAWGDPVNHPWTWGLMFAHTSEAVLWGAFIERHIDELAPNGGTVTVGALLMNNDFGKAYDIGFRGYLANSPVRSRIVYVPEPIEPSAPTIKDAMTTLASRNPDVFIAMTAGTTCTQAVTEAAENGLKERASYLFTSQPCKPASFMGRDKVGGDGSAANGWWIAGGGSIDFNAAVYDDDAWVRWARELLRGKGYDYRASANFGTGFLYGWAYWQAIRIASELAGGLTRTNLLLAARSMDMTNPNLLPGIGFNLDGERDGYPIEGSELARWDAAGQTWVPQGDVIELSGRSHNCAWDTIASVCR